jgi:hypothetical protein
MGTGHRSRCAHFIKIYCQSSIACCSRTLGAVSSSSRGCIWRRCSTGRTGRSTGSTRRSGAWTSRVIRVRQAEPGSRVTLKYSKVPVAACCASQPWSEQWEQPEFKFAWLLAACCFPVMPDTRNHQRNADTCDFCSTL